MGMLNKERLTKKRWYAIGGFTNPRCFRRMFSGAWRYYIDRG